VDSVVINNFLETSLREVIPGLEIEVGQGRDAYGKDEGYARMGRDLRPDIVVKPNSTIEVSKILKFAFENDVPVTPWGAGTSLEGQGLAFHGGITIDLRGLNKIRRTLIDDFQVEVEVGVLQQDLDKKLRELGVFFPPNPGAPATIGGMISNNSSGSRAVKYGVTRDYVKQLEVVLADGTITKLGTRATKTSSGFDLLDVVVGSEGTLCIITAAVLKVIPTPSDSTGLVLQFKGVEEASHFVQPVLGSGFLPCTIELLDERVVAVLSANSPLPSVSGAVLLIECDGNDPESVEKEIQGIADLAHSLGGTQVQIDQNEFKQIMKARKVVGWDIVRASGMKTLKLLDVAVPLSAFGSTVLGVYKILDTENLSGYVFGHAGDGNLHVLIASDSRNEEIWEKTLRAELNIVKLAIDAEGTITGEHGIGASKTHFLRLEHGSAVDLMRAVKNAFDPKGILNSGKVLPPISTQEGVDKK
jgi:glycolate oxidase subunit GlcD